MRESVWRLVLLASIWLAACGSRGSLEEEHRRALEDTLARRADEMLATLRRMDADAVVALYGRTETFVHVENGREITWRQLEPQMRQYLAAATTNDIQWLAPPKALVLSENAGVAWGVHRFRSAAESHVGVWTGVLQRIDGVWRIVHSHSSDLRDAESP